MGALEHIVTEVGIDRKKHNEKVMFTFFDLGTVYCDWKDYIFPSKKMDEKEKNHLKDLISTDPNLQDCKMKSVKKIPHWNITQVIGNINKKNYIAELLKENKKKGKIITDKNVSQARWSFGIPGQKILIEDRLENILKKVKKTNKDVRKINEKINKYGKDNKQATITRTINRLYGIKTEDQRQKFKKTKIGMLLPEKVLKKQESIDELITKLNSKIKLLGDNEIKYNKDQKQFAVNLDSPRKYFRWKKYMDADEIINAKWCFFDIEIPQFKSDKPEISWVGISYVEKGKVYKKEIHTIHKHKLKETEGYKIILHKSEKDLVKGLKENILKENPLFYSAYNARFDLPKLREAGDFAVGERNTEPIFEATNKFFERMGIRGKQVIDFYNWAKIALCDKVNRKLVMTSGTLLEEKVQKDISYGEMACLDKEFAEGNLKSGEIIAKYLRKDVDLMPQLFFTEEIKNSIRDAVKIANDYKVPLTKIFHTKKCIVDASDRKFFNELGTYKIQYREVIEKGSAEKEKFKNFFRKISGFKSKEGRYKEVYKVYLPIGDFFREEIYRRFPEGKKFFDYKYSKIDKDGNIKDKRRQFFLSQFSEGLIDEMIINYMLLYRRHIKKQGKDPDKQLKKLEKKKLKLLEELEFKDHHFTKTIYNNLVEKLKEDSSRMETEESNKYTWGLFHLKKKTLKPEKYYEYCDLFTKQRLENLFKTNRRTFKQFKNLCDVETDIRESQQKSTKKIEKLEKGIINFSKIYTISPEHFEDELKYKIEKVRRFIEANGFEVIHIQNKYLYLVGGNKKALDKAKFIHIDTIDDAIVSKKDSGHNIYYKQLGFYQGAKVKDDADWHFNRTEMKMYDKVLTNALEGNYKKAIQEAYRILNIANKSYDPEDFVWKSKTSLKRKAYLTRKDPKKKNCLTYYDPKDIIGKKDIKIDEEGHYFVEEMKKVKIGRKKKEVPVKIKVYDTEDVMHEFNEYRKRLNTRTGYLLNVIAKEQRQAFYNLKDSELNRLRQWCRLEGV